MVANRDVNHSVASSLLGEATVKLKGRGRTAARCELYRCRHKECEDEAPAPFISLLVDRVRHVLLALFIRFE